MDTVRIFKDGGFEIQSSIKLSDGSGCAVGSLPLPKDHWVYADHDNIPPMPLKVGTENALRYTLLPKIKDAAKYAIRTATMNGKCPNFDPDAMVQNFIIGCLGYNTSSSLSSSPEFNPKPNPPTLINLNYQL